MKKLIPSLLFLACSSAFALGASGAIDNTATTVMVCKAGYTAKVRPSTLYTDRVKKMLIADEAGARACVSKSRFAGLGWVESVRVCAAKVPESPEASKYELNHVVPLAVGGEPYDISNLALQPWQQAKASDILERQTQRDLCAGKLTLDQARARFLGVKH